MNSKSAGISAGFKLPAGVDIMPEFQIVHHDEAEFERAKLFWPERFINENGEFVKVSQFSLLRKLKVELQQRVSRWNQKR